MRGRRERSEAGQALRSRRLLADAIDAAVGMSLLWLLHRQRRLTGPRASEVSVGWLLEPSNTLVREQLASPGQRLAGLRTVDRRTGRRVALWRTMVLFGASAGGQWLGRRLAPGAQTPGQERERESFRAELDAIYERHPNDHAAREAERERLFERPTPPQVSLWRAVAPPLAAGLATTLLRRRLAPTVEVVAKGQSP